MGAPAGASRFKIGPDSRQSFRIPQPNSGRGKAGPQCGRRAQDVRAAAEGVTKREALLPRWPPGFHPCDLTSPLSLLVLVASVTGDQDLGGVGVHGACVFSAPVMGSGAKVRGRQQRKNFPSRECPPSAIQHAVLSPWRVRDAEGCTDRDKVCACSTSGDVSWAQVKRMAEERGHGRAGDRDSMTTRAQGQRDEPGAGTA